MTGIITSIVAIVGLVGLTVAVTPLIMPPTECFTVTVPPSAKRDPRIKALFRSYVVIVAVATVVGMVLVALRLPKAGDVTAAVVMIAATLMPVVVSFAYMLHARNRVRELKLAEGWIATANRSATFVSDGTAPEPLPLAWELLHIVVVAALAAFALLAYDRLPNQIPMHAGLDGTVNGYADKSVGAVLFPAAFAAFMGITMAFAHWMILRSKRPVDPAAPVTSALAYGEYARAQSIVLFVGGLLLSAGTGISFFSVKYGQAGGRVAAELRTTDSVFRDDDAYWKLGVFYCNSNDPSIVVPKRFGSGWTINIARPAAWAVVVGLIVVTVAFSVIMTRMVG